MNTKTLNEIIKEEKSTHFKVLWMFLTSKEPLCVNEITKLLGRKSGSHKDLVNQDSGVIPSLLSLNLIKTCTNYKELKKQKKTYSSYATYYEPELVAFNKVIITHLSKHSLTAREQIIVDEIINVLFINEYLREAKKWNNLKSRIHSIFLALDFFQGKQELKEIASLIIDSGKELANANEENDNPEKLIKTLIDIAVKYPHTTLFKRLSNEGELIQFLLSTGFSLVSFADKFNKDHPKALNSFIKSTKKQRGTNHDNQ